MAVWSLFRYRYSDGSSKDWAITTNADGSISTRWGKTASRLPSINTRSGIRQHDIERQKQAKGYVFVGEVEIDSEGNIRLPRSAPMADASPMPSENPSAPIDKLYWHIDCRAGHATLLDMGIALRCWLGNLEAWSQAQGLTASDWSGWQRLIDASLGDEAFDLSGQIHLEHGVLPWLWLMALKHAAFPGVSVGIATESGRDVSADLKAETEVLALFKTDVEAIRPLAENLGLLKPRLDLALAMADQTDHWF
ncbi:MULTISPECIES: hypothetical protein [Methylomonas]|uniref:Uncharacterized protein n=1 Tax=Methylomonas koyamae TaxID=702114 RepID=A0A177NIV5_9GAMM|nr:MULTISPECIES: hypothetical protein [Methylomonas]NOV30738.1 hypothetical protein [Methylomonas sp. ZR1]OAI17514.1 hypothetical protein A1355_07705 [Methylomonas koyamae]